jgi:hypothetical protein
VTTIAGDQVVVSVKEVDGEDAVDLERGVRASGASP